MRFVLNRRVEGQLEFGIIYGMIALLALLSVRLFPVLVLAPGCAFRALVGAPCPTCGSTRALVYLSHGNIISAFFMNPLVVSIAVAAPLLLLYSLVTLVFDMPRVGIDLSEKEKDRIRVMVVLLFVVNWLYLVITL
jgi:hypothetical protein